jgi:hypothetical protein
MLIVHNIDPKLLGELLVEAARARSKSMPGRERYAAPGQERDAIRPEREPGETGGGGRAMCVLRAEPPPPPSGAPQAGQVPRPPQASAPPPQPPRAQAPPPPTGEADR